MLIKYKLFMSAVLLCAVMTSNAQSTSQTDSLTMENMMHELPEIMVKGSRPIVKAERGMLSYNMPLLLKQLPADNAYEALTRIPGVSDANGSINFSGNEVTLIINGQATTLTKDQIVDRLKAMPAAQLAKAEVMFSAPARLHVRGMAINTVTKDNSGANQVSGQLVGAWEQSKYGLGVTKGYVDVQRGKLGMDAQYSFYDGHSYTYTASNANQSIGNEHMSYNESTHQKSFRKGHNYRLGLNYAFSKNHRLSAAYSGKWSDSNSDLRSYGSGTSEQHTNNTVYLHNADLNYTLPFGLQLSGSYTYYRNPQRQGLDGTLYDVERDLTTNSRQTINKWMFAADQSHSLKHDWGLSYGMKAQFSRNNSYQTTLDKQGNELPDASSNVNVLERIWNLYAGFSKQFTKAISLEASVAAEQYHTPKWNEWRCYPTVNAIWKINTNNILNLSFNSNSEFPSYWSTMSGIFYSSTYREIWGSPNLKPYSYYNINLMWQYRQRYTLMAFASIKPCYAGQLPYQPSDRLAVIFQEINYDYNRNFGLQASAIFSGGKWLNGNVYAIGTYRHDKSRNFFDLPFDRKKITASLGGTVSMKLCTTQNLRLIINPFLQSKAIQGVYDINPMFLLNATLQWTSHDGAWGVRIKGNNLLNTKFKSRSVGGNQDFHLTTMPGWVSGTFAVIYKFGGYKEKTVKAIDTSRMGH